MKEVIRKLAVYIFYGLAGGVLAWTISLTWDVLSNKVLVNQPEKAIFGLLLFDAGMIGWLVTFIFHAKGLGQRAIALGMTALSLAGVVVMCVGDLFLNGQNLAAIPANLGPMIVWVIGGMTALDVMAIVTFHIADPETSQEIQLQTQEDRIVDEAIKTTEASLQAQSLRLAARISERMEAKALYRLGLLESGAPVIDVESRDAGQAVTPTKKRKRGLLDLIRGRQPEPVVVAPAPTQAAGFDLAALARLLAEYTQAQASQPTSQAQVYASETVTPPTVEEKPEMVRHMVGDMMHTMPNIKIPLYPEKKVDPTDPLASQPGEAPK